jgi:hypothetical protein
MASQSFILYLLLTAVAHAAVDTDLISNVPVPIHSTRDSVLSSNKKFGLDISALPPILENCTMF